MIEVGEYVRTKDKILKVDSFEKDNRNVDCVCFTTGEIYTLELLNKIMAKHSENIIDLIEVGDVIEVHFLARNTIRKIYIDEYCKDSMILNGIISGNVILKTILTKEQYMQNCYKLDTD